jgi:hypothetical protein
MAEEARLMLACSKCPERFANDTEMEAVRLHYNVEHDTDEIEINLIVVCSCGTTMDPTRTEPVGDGTVLDHFACPSCKGTTAIGRRPKTEET